ncbi:MAG TPA: flagellar hook capping FlgD N-terminal domain-containing protein [Burkholderiaceae bacterium]|jgi:flagellar basal-body rod modification protein FlgD|nr:flagellar hook capping FlgD N-terminal domain-containing protein [Burkholderiaceae bacterium]
MPSSVDFSNLNTTSTSTVKTKNDAGAEDRFLKLLVAQMQNQDPLNPMDNAQVTSQMAQIQSVNGIEKLNRTVEGLGTQFAQLSALQGASLVGRDVIVAGNQLTTNDEGLVQGGFELASAADRVQVEILNAGGRVIDTLELGAQGSGRHGFEWTPPEGVEASLGQRFRIVAKSGTANVTSTPLMRDRVDAVIAGGDQLTLELRNSGSVAYADIRAFN